MYSAKVDLLGLAVRRDREELGLTQDQVDVLAAEAAKRFNVRLSTRWCGQIERCVKREVSIHERKLLAFCLKQPENRYFHLATDPRATIGALLAKESKVSTSGVLERSIVFPPEHKQAGVAILSYFSEVVGKKYPHDDVQVSILQNGNKVTLRIETRDGKIDNIEKTLEEYGLVVVGEMPIDKFTDDRELIRDLKTRLEVTSLELRLRKEAFLEQKTSYDKRVNSLEGQVQSLFALVSTGLRHAHSLGELIKQVSENTKCNARVAASLEKISELAQKAYSEENARAMENAFIEVQKEAPSVYQYLRSTLASIPGGVMGNLATPWVQDLISRLPKMI